MDAFRMKIAGKVIEVQPLFESTKAYCLPYLTEQDADFSVEITSDDLIREQLALEQEAIEEGLKIRKFKEPFLERSSIQRRVADYLVGSDILMLHGSTVSVDGKAYLFTAPCGTGKSTHTRLWRELFGERAVMVNDDKPFLEIKSDRVLAYGSPWSGKHGLASNVCVPLKGICLLHRGNENVIKAIEPEHIIAFLYQQAHKPDNAVLAEKSLALVDQLTKVVSTWDMYCNKKLDAAKVAYAAMCYDYN